MVLDAHPYDALLLVSFGGPEAPADVVPFLENVTAGKGIPRERLAEVGEHYYAFGGRSPINDQCRELLEAITGDFAAHGLDVPVYWGNRNWDPYLKDTLAAMKRDGIGRAACLVTSAYASYSGCRQYRENLWSAANDTGVRLDRIRHYFNHPGFVDPVVESSASSLQRLGNDARLVFVTHSIPTSMNASSGGPGVGAYERQHLDLAAHVGTRVSRQIGRTVDWSLAYCSRSGPPSVPWLEPDINDHLGTLAAAGVTAAAVAPIGFISDHMEVMFDLDTEAAATAEGLGLDFARVATPGADPRFVAMVRDLLIERAAVERGEHPDRCAVGELGPSSDRCAADCCVNPREALPVIGAV